MNGTGATVLAVARIDCIALAFSRCRVGGARDLHHSGIVEQPGNASCQTLVQRARHRGDCQATAG